MPLEVNEAGVYLVEAVSGLLRAYTIVIVSDVGLVTKVSPGSVHGVRRRSLYRRAEGRM